VGERIDILIVAALVLWLRLHSRHPLPRWASAKAIAISLPIKVVASGRPILKLILRSKGNGAVVVVIVAREARLTVIRTIPPVPVGL
jgi:hypothetical protein